MAFKKHSMPFGIKTDKKWLALQRYPHPVADFIHQNDGPWPQPAPDNPVGQMAEVVHLPKQEQKDWQHNVGNMYIKRLLFNWPQGLWYALTHSRYKHYSDDEFTFELSEGLYSKFITPLDNGDLELIKSIPSFDESIHYVKADFSCMEPVAPNCFDGMFAASSITFFETVQNDDERIQKLKVCAIWLYDSVNDAKPYDNDVTNASKKQRLLTPDDGDAWHLAKYFVLQGAVHRVNLTEHALLHFPYDPINAVSKSILPTNHLLHQLLMPHFLLSLGVNKAVLENKGSLINRDKHKFYSPFCAEGEYIRQLLPDGYLGRKGKPNAYPAFHFAEFPKFPKSEYGLFLKAYYDVFEHYVTQVLNVVDDDNEEEHWLYIALWLDSIEEWIPGFPRSEEVVVITKNGAKPLVKDGEPVGRIKLIKTVSLIMWDLSVAHATDHIAINNKRPHGNPFRLRVAPPYQQPDKNWHDKLVQRKDLLTFWFTDLLFYRPNNVTELQNVTYPFAQSDAQKTQHLKALNVRFKQALQDCDTLMQQQLEYLPCRLEQISTSLQY